MRHIRYRQLILLLTLMLPTLGIAFVGKEFLKAEQAEIKATLKKASEAIRGSTSLELERIKTKAIASFSTGNRKYSDPAILLVGSVAQSNGERYLDWTSQLKTPEVVAALGRDPEVVREITAAKRLEQSRNLRDAISSYRTVLVHLGSLSASGDSAVQRAATEMSGELASHVAQLELAHHIGTQFSSLFLREDKWTQYGEGAWLSLTPPTGASSHPLVIAVRREDIVKRVEKVRRENGNPINFTLVAGTTVFNKTEAPTSNADRPIVNVMEVWNGNDSMVVAESVASRDDSIKSDQLALGDQFPGLQVLVYSDAESQRLLANHKRFYAILLAFFLTVPLVGWYLMLRDTRNETRIAEMRSQFVSNVSHELRTPLTSILLFAETLRMRGLTDPLLVAEHLDTIISQSERLTRLLNNVLTFSKIERGQADYHMKLTRLDDVVRSTERAMQFPLAEQGFHLKVDIRCELPPMRIDSDAVEQAILNLLTNAMKYSGKSRDITLRLDADKGNALIQVVDLGIGIAPREQKRIFEKFYRVESLESSAISGVGIGLALVAHIAKGHGGSVEVHSDLAKGSTFTIYIPIRENRNP